MLPMSIKLLTSCKMWATRPSSISSATFWHPVCQNLAISRSKAYTIKVVVSGVNNRSPHKMLMAVLQGGGNELP